MPAMAARSLQAVTTMWQQLTSTTCCLQILMNHNTQSDIA